MKVLVAGATGAIGVPAVRAVVAAGHDVSGTTRSASKRGAIETAGARAVIMDALDPRSAQDAIEHAAPDVIVELLTALPKVPMRASHLEPTNKLRTAGTANLLAAAPGIPMVAESIAFFYETGPRVHTEDDPIPEQTAIPMVRPAARALREHERLVLDAKGIVLRFGLFYGPDTQSSRYTARSLRRRMLPVVDHGRGILPWIHVDDGAAAIVAAVERGTPGSVYNVVEDGPLSVRETFDAFADAVGAPHPWSVPKSVARLASPYPAEFMTWEVHVSNEKAKRELGWSPAYPTAREGARTLERLRHGA